MQTLETWTDKCESPETLGICVAGLFFNLLHQEKELKVVKRIGDYKGWFGLWPAIF